MNPKVSILFLVTCLWYFPILGQDLRIKYNEVKKSGLLKVYGSYHSELDALKQRASAAGIIDNVITIDDEIKKVQEIVDKIESGENVIPIGKFDDASVKVDGRFRGLKNSYSDRIAKALETLDSQYITLIDQAMKRLVREGNIDEVRKLKAFHDELTLARRNEDGKDLLAQSSDWVVVRGDWDFGESKVLGEGDSELLYSGAPLPEEFILEVDVRVKTGIRPRIYIGEYTFCNVGNMMAFVLFPKEKTNLDEKNHPWKHNRTYRVKMVYGKRLFELYVDGEIVERHVEPTEPVQRLALSAGDYFSKGEVEFSNLKIRESL